VTRCFLSEGKGFIEMKRGSEKRRGRERERERESKTERKSSGDFGGYPSIPLLSF
jgi:hypothetical protein